MTPTTTMVDTSTLTKRYYTIAEVSVMFDVAKSLLRYWEGEFKEIQPRKDRGGIRRYTVKDVEHINKIYDLVKVRGFTIDGARKELSTKGKSSSSKSDLKLKLKAIQKRLMVLRDAIS